MVLRDESIGPRFVENAAFSSRDDLRNLRNLREKENGRGKRANRIFAVFVIARTIQYYENMRRYASFPAEVFVLGRRKKLSEVSRKIDRKNRLEIEKERERTHVKKI